jgi:peptide subunit release factor 1 (eRF1)
MLHAQTSGPCITCRAPLRPVTDVVEYAVERAQEESAEIEFVTESPTLEALGSIGALLRF